MDNFDNAQNICRMCLVQNNGDTQSSQSVFNTIDSAGKLQQFSRMLMTIAEVEIILGDGLPSQICSTCAQNTINLYLFKIQCEESDKTLRDRLKEGPFIVIDQIDIDEEDIFDKINSEIKGENVEVSGDLKESGGAHCVQQNENNPLDTIVYEDDTSAKYSESLNTFNNDIITDSTVLITEESLEDGLSREKDVQRKNIAEIAQKIKRVDQKFDSERHEITNDKYTVNGVAMKSLVIILEDCNKMSSLKNFMKTRKQGKKPLLTSGKKKSFNESKNIRQQSRDFTKSTSPAKDKLIGFEKNTFECDVCNKKLSSSSTYKDHKRIHTGEKPYECDVCKERFKVQSHLIVHKRTHTGEKPYQCTICKQRFTQSNTLMVHKRKHTGEKPYECDVCKQRFAVSSHLKVHKRTHTGEKPYECNVCKQRFIHSSNLVVHKRKHSGETPYKCDICKQRFSQSSGLIIHKRVHTGEKPYECDICKQRFTQSSGLIIHKRVHTGEKPYQCDVCKQRFKQSSSLSTHKRKIHRYRQKIE